MRADRLSLPESLRDQLLAFRRRLWTVKMAEAGCGAAFGVLAGYLITFGLDRMFDTPSLVRGALFAAAVVCCALLPLALHRWVWSRRQLDQLARLLSWKHPSIGDQLLGVIELVRSDSEQQRSRALCEAAIAQVAERAKGRDFRDAVPRPRHVAWGSAAAGAIAVAILLAAVYTDAATNAWARFLRPWADTPRYTFTMVERLPNELVVAYGEPFELSVALSDSTVWRPAAGEVHLPGQPIIAAKLRDGRYSFELHGQVAPGPLHLRVGDLTKTIHLEPTMRPELTSILADVALPTYLQRDKGLSKDVRGGTVTLVKGSKVSFLATASRELASAKVNGQAAEPDGAKISSPTSPVEGPGQVEFDWKDRFGLTGREPFEVTINGRDDESPSIACENLPRQKVVLDSEQLTFQVHAQDDFGVKRVGIEWQGLDEVNIKDPAKGERILSAGGADRESLDLTGTFSAKSLGIQPQPIQLRLFVEDYFPDRPRVYSPTYVLYVLDPEQHAIWLTEQLSKWHRQSLEVRDRELQLHEANKQLRDLSPEQLDEPENRRKLDAQAGAERANGRRLSNLVESGEDLVRQATRNPEFGVGHLEKWAEMLQILKDISDNRMPSVADMLKQAAEAPTSQQSAGQSTPQDKQRMAGQVRASGGGGGDKPEEGGDKPKTPNVPRIADVESTQLDLSKDEGKSDDGNKSKSTPRLTLPSTTLLGGAKNPDSCPAGDKVEEAIAQQEDLLAEFDKIADELNRVLGNLEGTTLVKRLKAASRMQYGIAGRMGDVISDTFGGAVPQRRSVTPTPGVVPGVAMPQQVVDAAGDGVTAAPTTNPMPPTQPAKPANERVKKLLGELAEQEAKGSQDVSNIMDDMQAYFERRRFVHFKSVLDEMRSQDVIGSLRQLSDDIAKEHGLSIAQCEFWSDTLDRWAEDLVDPASGGS